METMMKIFPRRKWIFLTRAIHQYANLIWCPSDFQISGAAWEEAFLDVVGKAEDEGAFKHISIARFASRTLELELEANTKTVVPYFTSTFIIMGLFSIVTCMMTDWVRSKPWLGLLGNISAAMATVAAFGLCIYLGVDFIGINLAAPFLMIGKSRSIFIILSLSFVVNVSNTTLKASSFPTLVLYYIS